MVDFLILIFLLLFIPGVKGFLIGSFIGYFTVISLNDKDVSLNDKFIYGSMLHICSVLIAYIVSDAVFLSSGFEFSPLSKLGMFFIVYAFSLIGIKFITGRFFPVSWDFGLSFIKEGIKKVFLGLTLLTGKRS